MTPEEELAAVNEIIGSNAIHTDEPPRITFSPRWIPVADGWPLGTEDVLVFAPEGDPPMFVVQYMCDADKGEFPGVTHWMPLPHPPKP